MMPGYQPITAIAASLLTDERTLLDFRRKGWIQAAERNGTVVGSAVYSAAEVGQIVGRRAASVNPEGASD
jgi:hypothetical protein